MPVTGTINGFPFRNSLMPEGDGSHSMMVNKALQGGASASKGDLVTVAMDFDKTERTVVVPPGLGKSLRREPVAKRFFGQLPYSCRKEYVEWITGAKRPETRTARIAKAIGLLVEGKRQR